MKSWGKMSVSNSSLATFRHTQQCSGCDCGVESSNLSQLIDASKWKQIPLSTPDTLVGVALPSAITEYAILLQFPRLLFRSHEL